LDESKFKFKNGDIIKDDKRNLIVLDTEYRIKKKKRGDKYIDANVKYYKLKCNVCGYNDLHVEEWNLLNGRGCSCCSGHAVVEEINDIPTTAPWMIKYFQGGYDEAKLYTKTSKKSIYPICPDCGKVKTKQMLISNINKYMSIGCECSDGISYPNKFILNLIKQCDNQVKYYETEYSPDWVKPKRYDMYFTTDSNKKYIVEMDGGLGHGNMSQYPESAKLSIKNDIIKEDLARENNIEIIRILCEPSNFETIYNNILNSELNGILDLSNVDWIKCDKNSMSNMIKEVCLMKKENELLSS
jgi:hypothetical protein